MAGERKLTLELAVDDQGSIKIAHFNEQIKKTSGSVDSMSRSLSLIKWDAIVNLGEKAYRAAKQIYDYAKGIAEAGDNLSDMSKMLGMSTDDFQRWSYAAKQSDLDMGSFSSGVKIFSQHVMAAAAGQKESTSLFDAMKISIKGASGEVKPLSELMREVSGKMSGYADGMEKINLVTAAFGKGGMAWIEMLNRGSDGLDELNKRLERLGGPVGSVTLETLSRSKEAFIDLDVSVNNLKLSMSGWIETLASVVTKLSELIGMMSGVSKKAKEMQSDVFASFYGGQGVPTEEDFLRSPMGGRRDWASEGRFKLPLPKAPIPTPTGKGGSATKEIAEETLGWIKEWVKEHDKYNGLWMETKDIATRVTAEEKAQYDLLAYETPTLQQILEMDARSLKFAQDKADALKAQQEHLEEILSSYNSMQNEVYGRQYDTPSDAQIQQMDIRSAERDEAIRKTAEDSRLAEMKKTADFWGGQVESMANVFTSGFENVLIHGFDNIGDAFKDLGKMMLGELIKITGGGLFGLLGMVKAQEGGIFTRPTIAMIGEKGPEAVIPLSHGGSSKGSGNVYNVFNITAWDAKGVNHWLRHGGARQIAGGLKNDHNKIAGSRANMI